MIQNLENQSRAIFQQRVKRDPAIGSSMLPTLAITASMDRIFPGLATLP